MSDHHKEISEDNIFFLKKQEIVLNDFDAAGYILDIGGGGEGVIGKLKGNQVIAIDPSKRELEEAPPGPLKIVMDGTDLKFLDDTFGTVTSFFTLMYVKGADDHARVFGEVFRVLAPGGRFLIWDANLPRRFDEEKEVVAFFLLVKLPEGEIDTGYGADWPEEDQDLAYYRRLAENAGFNIAAQRENEHVPVYLLSGGRIIRM